MPDAVLMGNKRISSCYTEEQRSTLTCATWTFSSAVARHAGAAASQQEGRLTGAGAARSGKMIGNTAGAGAGLGLGPEAAAAADRKSDSGVNYIRGAEPC